MGAWRWRPAIVRVAETEGAVGPAFLIASEIARQAEASGTSAAPGIAIRRLGRCGHRIHCQCQDGENNTNDRRLAHRTLSRDSLPRTLSQNLAETDSWPPSSTDAGTDQLGPRLRDVRGGGLDAPADVMNLCSLHPAIAPSVISPSTQLAPIERRQRQFRLRLRLNCLI